MTDHDPVLDCPMQGNDAEAKTIREYLVALARGAWVEEDGFGGKRPFGNSSWKFEVYTALGHAGLIEASFDDDGYLDSADRGRANEMILAALDRLAGLSVLS